MGFGLLALLSPEPQAQSVLLDINQVPRPQSASSAPGGFLPLGSEVFFSAELLSGIRAFKSDGTAGGTRMLPGIPIPRGRGVSIAPGVIVYSGLDPVSGDPGVYRTDTTLAGTWELPMPATGQANRVVSYPGGALILWTQQVGPDVELSVWSTDGSIASTRRWWTHTSGSSLVGELVVLDQRVIFEVPPSTALSTSVVVSFDLSGQGVQVLTGSRYQRLDGKRALALQKAGGGTTELLVSNGTAPGTSRVATLPGTVQPISTNDFAEIVGGRAVFRVDEPLTGSEPWSTDGTAGGTQPLGDLHPGAASSSAKSLGLLRGRLVFWAVDASGPGLYSTNGTAAGTSRFLANAPSLVFAAGGELPAGLVFQASDPASGLEPWITDGTAAGTAMLADLAPGSASSRAAFDRVPLGRVLIGSATTPGIGAELWVTDGSRTGTVLVKDIYVDPGFTESSNPVLGGRLGDRFYFRADDGVVGPELWGTDGTPQGTHLVADLLPGPKGSSPRDFVFSDAFFVFTAFSPSTGTQLYASDGTAAGTRIVGPRNRKGAQGDGARLADGSLLLLLQGDLWRTDGTPAGTTLVAALPPHRVRIPHGFTPVNGGFIFLAGAVGAGELFFTDGTTQGTRLLANLAITSTSGGIGGELPSPTLFRGEAYFEATDGSFRGLWKTDGTAAGTVPVAALSRIVDGPLATPQRLLFFAEPAVGVPPVPYSTDGTVAGTAVFSPMIGGKLMGGLAGGDVVFQNGKSLWRTDGVVAGPYSSLPVEFTLSNGRPGAEKLLLAQPRLSRFTLIATDGTRQGTRELPGCPEQISRDPAMRIGEHVLFEATDPAKGSELFTVRLRALEDYAAETFGRGCAAPGNPIPSIGLTGAPLLTSPSFDITLQGAPPGALAVLAWSPRGASAQANGCFIGLGAPIRLVPRTTDGQGRAHVTFALSPALVGYSVKFQWAAVAPRGPLAGLRLSPALEVVGGV